METGFRQSLVFAFTIVAAEIAVTFSRFYIPNRDKRHYSSSPALSTISIYN